MNTMPIEKRIQILGLLAEGNSMRSIERTIGCSINTVTKLLCDVGAACAQYHDKNVCGLKTKLVQCDEIWGFCYAKQKDIAIATAATERSGDVWMWTAIDADSKLMISYLLGGRDAESALEFMDDLRSRVDNRVQITNDRHKAYLQAAYKSFGSDIDDTQLVKMYGNEPDGQKGKYSPAVCTGIKKACISGNPVKKSISTSYVERQNPTMRIHMRRFTRSTGAFSKKLEKQLHAVSFHFTYYNFAKPHKTLGVTPAMQAGISDHVWGLEEIARLVPEPVAKKRGAYNKKKNTSN